MIREDKYIILRFYAELNDFLPQKKKMVNYNLPYFGSPTVKDIIESQGIPHTEIDLILVNGTSVGFKYRIKPLDKVSVYPEFELLDISPLVRLRPKPLRITRFVADAHLGKLSRYLRMLGFDTIYKNDIRDEVIIDYSIREKRIILTRDLGILKHSRVERGYFIRNQKPFDQCGEIMRKFSLGKQISPFTRCMECNGQFNKISKILIKGKVREMVYRNNSEFYMCVDCKNIYWKGSHCEKMLKIIKKLLST